MAFVRNDLIVRRNSDAFKERTYFDSNQYRTSSHHNFQPRSGLLVKCRKKTAIVAEIRQSTIQTLNTLLVQSTTGNTSTLEPVKLPTFSGKQILDAKCYFDYLIGSYSFLEKFSRHYIPCKIYRRIQSQIQNGVAKYKGIRGIENE